MSADASRTEALERRRERPAKARPNAVAVKAAAGRAARSPTARRTPVARDRPHPSRAAGRAERSVRMPDPLTIRAKAASTGIAAVSRTANEARCPTARRTPPERGLARPSRAAAKNRARLAEARRVPPEHRRTAIAVRPPPARDRAVGRRRPAQRPMRGLLRTAARPEQVRRVAAVPAVVVPVAAVPVAAGCMMVAREDRRAVPAAESADTTSRQPETGDDIERAVRRPFRALLSRRATAASVPSCGSGRGPRKGPSLSPPARS